MFLLYRAILIFILLPFAGVVKSFVFYPDVWYPKLLYLYIVFRLLYRLIWTYYNPKWIKLLGLYCSIFLVIWTISLCGNINKLTNSFQNIYTISTVPYGTDGISICFMLLTALIFPLCLLSHWELANKLNYTSLIFYSINMLLLELFLLSAFYTTNLLFFYVYFEATVIPMLFIIGIWGPGYRRIKANYYFIFYTIGGSALLLFSILVIGFDFGSFDYTHIFDPSNVFILNKRLQILLWIPFFISFAVKVPMFPFHIWLPEAHVEAPTTGSVILAALLLKLGGYGFIRFLPLFPYAYSFFSPLVFSLSLLGILFASMAAIRQIDLKKIIAYSSIAHMNLSVIGIFSLTYQGIQGSLFLLISHGLVSSGLFFLVGMLYDRYYTKLLKYYGGLVLKMPIFSLIFFLFSIANFAFPGTSNFISELLVLIGVTEKNINVMIIASSGMLFSSIYSIWIFNRIAFGNPKTAYIEEHQDFTRREYFVIMPLLILVFLLGISPNIILDVTYFSVKNLITYC